MLDKRDLSLALALHVLVVMAMFAANQWKPNMPERMPEHTIKVNMVSLQELQAMMPKLVKPKVSKPKPTRPVVEPIKTVQKEDETKVVVIEPKKKLEAVPKPSPKPVPQPKKVVVPPQVKVRKKVEVEEEMDYDPFAPLESTKKKPRTTRVSSKQTLEDMLAKQLSEEELAKYILGMQQAVATQWKVSTEMIDRVNDALVELQLFRNGAVKKVRILESSGSAVLDASLTQAIYAAAPFQIPDQQYALFKVNTIRFFPLK